MHYLRLQRESPRGMGWVGEPVIYKSLLNFLLKIEMAWNLVQVAYKVHQIQHFILYDLWPQTSADILINFKAPEKVGFLTITI